jgi:hypothetical protein
VKPTAAPNEVYDALEDTDRRIGFRTHESPGSSVGSETTGIMTT